jgi:hypothetical protein
LLDGPTHTFAFDAKTCPRWIAANDDGHGYYRVAYTEQQLAALRDEAWPLLTPSDRHDIFFNTVAGAAIGKLPLQLALSFVPRMLVDSSRFSIAQAVALPVGLDTLVPDELRGKYEAWLRQSFGLAEAQTAFVPKEGEDIDVEGTRGELLDAVGWYGRDPKVVDEALELAKHWRGLAQAIRQEAVTLAVDAKQDDFDRFVAELHREPDRTRRQELLKALGAVRDPQRYARVLELVADTSLDLRETLVLLETATTPAQHALVQQFYVAHEAELVKRMPTDEAANPIADLSSIFTDTCRAEKRDEMAAQARLHFAKFPGGERVVRQGIEEMDQCIARRKLLEPEVRGWLTGVKIPKPAPPAKKPPVKKK